MTDQNLLLREDGYPHLNTTKGENMKNRQCKCNGNPHTLECLYHHFLSYTGYEHSESLFTAYSHGAEVRALPLPEENSAESMQKEQDSLVKRLDIALNGDDAAAQASLCDIVAQCEATKFVPLPELKQDPVAWLYHGARNKFPIPKDNMLTTVMISFKKMGHRNEIALYALPPDAEALRKENEKLNMLLLATNDNMMACLADKERIIKENDQLRSALSDLAEMTDTPPDRNCNCHISPPCNDCVEYSGIRDALENARSALKGGAA